MVLTVIASFATWPYIQRPNPGKKAVVKERGRNLALKSGKSLVEATKAKDDKPPSVIFPPKLPPIPRPNFQLLPAIDLLVLPTDETTAYELQHLPPLPVLIRTQVSPFLPKVIGFEVIGLCGGLMNWLARG